MRYATDQLQNWVNKRQLLDSVALGASGTSIDLSWTGHWPILVFEGSLRSDLAANLSDGVDVQVGVGSLTVDSRYAWFQIRSGLSDTNDGSDTLWLAARCTAVNAAGGDFASVEIMVTQGTVNGFVAGFGTTGRIIGVHAGSIAAETTANTGMFGFMRAPAAWSEQDLIDITQITPRNGTNFIAGSSMSVYGYIPD